MPAGRAAGISRRSRAGRLRDSGGALAPILEEIRRTDLTTAARAVRVPTLIIAGGRDPLFGEAHQRALVQAIAGSRLVWARDCGHNPHWEDPAFVAKPIAGVLSAE
nr:MULTISPECIES: alpha/beta fold hydrolase [unclassified Mesorhizobium]